MTKHIIFGVHITDRTEQVGKIQELLSEYGCYIKTRLGLHETSKEACSSEGLVILEMLDDMQKAEELYQKLSSVQGIGLQRMSFDH
jgi:hypothetical protein